MKKFAQYRVFQHEDDLLGFIDRLELHNIPYETAKYASGLDHTYLGAGAGVEYSIRVPKDKFEDVNRILEKEAEEDFHELPPEYFLFEFTEAELKEVISNPHEWNRKDVVYAGKVLEDRGISFSISEVRENVKNNVERAFKPKKVRPALLTLGYVSVPLALIAGSLVGFLSLFIGFYLAFWTEIDYKGDKYYLFEPNSRTHGYVMIMGSLICITLVLMGISGNLSLPFAW